MKIIIHTIPTVNPNNKEEIFHDTKVEIDATPAEMKEVSDLIKASLPVTTATPMNLLAQICLLGAKSLG